MSFGSGVGQGRSVRTRSVLGSRRSGVVLHRRTAHGGEVPPETAERIDPASTLQGVLEESFHIVVTAPKQLRVVIGDEPRQVGHRGMRGQM